ncbi:hypothetical protein GCM10017655_45040 [Pseudomonas turukhanskensis]|uniref:Uncharacterized protein n=2 Tax=Pseudomonas turukhanskensis TaxID=1806536 RepID=A0A9W6K8E6_9PSED|nr:hypothetical protein GCM10017655_45040 [Pseudomonas turukhanskensis]
MALRLRETEEDQKVIDTYYRPVFKVLSRAVNSSSDEVNRDGVKAQQFGSAATDSSLTITATQRLPGGATLGLSVGKELGHHKSSDNLAGDNTIRSSQHSYQLEVRQPLLRGAGAPASVELNIGRLAIAQAHLSHEVFIQEDLLRTVAVYSDLLSCQQNVLQAERSLQASKDFMAATQAQVSQGVLAKSEMEQAQFSVSQGELELAYARQAEKDAIDQLRVFSGLAVEDGQRVRNFPQIDVGSATHADFSSMAAEIEAAKINVQIAEQQRTAAKDGDAIELDVVASTGKGWANRFSSSAHEHRNYGGWRSQSYVGLEMSKTLNDYSARAALRKSRLALEERKLELQDAKLRVNVRRAAAKRGLSSAYQYVQLIKKKIEVASKNLANERLKIDSGRSTAFMVYSAQSNLDQAQSEYIDANSRYIVAAARLYKELGKLKEFVDELSSVECSSGTLSKSPRAMAKE